MTKCEYCNFGNYERLAGYIPIGQIIYGLYGKKIDAKSDILNGEHRHYDFLRLIKSNFGYFIEANVTDEFDEDSYKNYSPIKFCPICGRKLPEFDKKQFEELIQRGQ